MQLEKIKFQKKAIAYLHLCLGYDPRANRDRLILSLTKDITKSSVGYAGFKTKQDLSRYLVKAVFNSRKKEISPKSKFDKGKMLNIIKKTIIRCHQLLPGDPINIFIFPTFSIFVKEKMSGATGYTPHQNTILLFIHPLSRNWQKVLSGIVAHEFNHATILKDYHWKTLLDSIISEGLAEHFQEQIAGGRRSPWTKTMDANQSKKLFLKLKKHLSSKSFKLYQSVFFGGKKYPLWAGYTIGFYLVRSFFKKNRDLGWKQIITLKPKEILKKSNF